MLLHWSSAYYDSTSSKWDPWLDWTTVYPSAQFSKTFTAIPGKSKIVFSVYALNTCGSSEQARESVDKLGIPFVVETVPEKKPTVLLETDLATEAALTAADAADKKGQPPPALITAWTCHRWNALPEPGGLRDQPMRLMADMTLCENVYDAISAWRRSDNWALFQKNNPHTWEIVSEVLRRRKHAR
jgi:hypothetical protein